MKKVLILGSTGSIGTQALEVIAASGELRAVGLAAGRSWKTTVAQAREHFKPYQPSSPQIAILKDGKIVFMMQRHDIEGRDPQTVAAGLAKAFDEHCKKK